MKLKSVLMLAFFVLTFIPILVVSILLYQSGYALSRESYTRNLEESINVQVDYISQTLENNMVMDYRFANRTFQLHSGKAVTEKERRDDILAVFQSYLESSEDKVDACILMDEKGAPIYTMGEKAVLDTVSSQLPPLAELEGQKIQEVQFEDGAYSLGILTPIRDSSQNYLGSLVSVYNKSYLFKIISSYYELADTSTCIIRGNGEIVNSRGLSEELEKETVEKALGGMKLGKEGAIDARVDGATVSGCYKDIYNCPWYLVGILDEAQIYDFANQFIWVYILIIVLIFLADIVLSFYFSKKVVRPINALIQVMDGYPESLKNDDLQNEKKSGYFETQYLRTKFLSLMRTILLIQHNFEGVYQLYQSSAMDDTNIDIDVKSQTIHSNKGAFEKLMAGLVVPEGACIVERFTRCFCDKDQQMLMGIFVNMRDKHLSITQETEVFTPHLNQKWFHILVVPMYEDERLSRLYIQLRDISSFKRQEHDSLEQAQRDPLTGLYNRSGFAACVGKILEEGGESARYGLLFIDMNYFKLVNDNLGHSAGDDLLCSVANVLQESVRPGDVASRFGGDEFAVFLSGASEDVMQGVKERLNRKLVYPFCTEKLNFTVSASIGVSLWSSSSPCVLDALLKQADDSMYQAKREFKKGMEGEM